MDKGQKITPEITSHEMREAQFLSPNMIIYKTDILTVIKGAIPPLWIRQDMVLRNL